MKQGGKKTANKTIRTSKKGTLNVVPPFFIPPPFHSPKELSALCPAEAAGPAHNRSRPLAVRPVPGRAVVFWHEAPLGDRSPVGFCVSSGKWLLLYGSTLI